MRISRLNETARQRMFLRISEKIMMYELWTAEAEKDLRGIFEYI